MDIGLLEVGNWYCAVYESGFSIIFKVIEINDNIVKLCRKDGIEVDSIPSGYIEILSNGKKEPEYD